MPTCFPFLPPSPVLVEEAHSVGGTTGRQCLGISVVPDVLGGLSGFWYCGRISDNLSSGLSNIDINQEEEERDATG